MEAQISAQEGSDRVSGYDEPPAPSSAPLNGPTARVLDDADLARPFSGEVLQASSVVRVVVSPDFVMPDGPKEDMAHAITLFAPSDVQSAANSETVQARKKRARTGAGKGSGRGQGRGRGRRTQVHEDAVQLDEDDALEEGAVNPNSSAVLMRDVHVQEAPVAKSLGTFGAFVCFYRGEHQLGCQEDDAEPPLDQMSRQAAGHDERMRAEP